MSSAGWLKTIGWLICLYFACIISGYGPAQRILADQVTHNSGNKPLSTSPTVLNPSNALTAANTYARLLASPGVAAGIGSYRGEIELAFPRLLPADTWAYVQIQGDTDLFGALLGGSLGEVLGGALGVLLIGRQGIEIQARNVGRVVLSRNSTQGFSTDRVRLVVDAGGNYYLAVKPGEAFDRVRIINRSISLLGLGSEYVLDVYNAFYVNNECSELPSFTSLDGNGVNVDLLKLGGDLSENLHAAIDGNPDSYSSLSPGLLSVAGVVSQFLYFDTLSESTDEVQVTISGTPSLLNLDVANTVRIKAYNGSVEVYNRSLTEINSLIDLDLLGLLQRGNPTSFTIAPGVPFDRIEILSGALLGLDVGESLRVHEVTRTPGRPTFDNLEGIEGQSISICPGEIVDLSVSHSQPLEFNWYSEQIGGMPFYRGEQLATDAALSESTTYYVSASKTTACGTTESARTPITVNIKDVPYIEEVLTREEEYEEGKALT